MDVVVWLRSLGLEEYEVAFRDNKIDERVLPSLTAEDLKEIGVGPVGHRRTLLEAIAALRADTRRSMVFENKGPPPKGGTFLVCAGAKGGLGCSTTGWRYDHFASRGGGQSGDGGIGLGTAGGAYAQNPYAIALWFWQKCHHVLDHYSA
jgi:hypothetical protein